MHWTAEMRAQSGLASLNPRAGPVAQKYFASSSEVGKQKPRRSQTIGLGTENRGHRRRSGQPDSKIALAAASSDAERLWLLARLLLHSIRVREGCRDSRTRPSCGGSCSAPCSLVLAAVRTRLRGEGEGGRHCLVLEPSIMHVLKLGRWKSKGT